MVAVTLSGVEKAFGDTVVLRGLDLRVEDGQTVALLGPSGSGKTTLLRILSGDVAVDHGEVSVLGCDLRRASAKVLRRLRVDIGHLYQNDALVPGLRTVHNVLLGRVGRWSLARSLLSLVWPQDIERARTALAAVGLADKLEASIGSLSGGQRQRVALARLLVQEPRLVLADEPATSLDPRLARELLDLLLDLVRKDQRTAIVSLHQLELVTERFDRVIALRDHRVFYDGPPSGVAAVADELFARSGAEAG